MEKEARRGETELLCRVSVSVGLKQLADLDTVERQREGEREREREREKYAQRKSLKILKTTFHMMQNLKCMVECFPMCQ